MKKQFDHKAAIRGTLTFLLYLFIGLICIGLLIGIIVYSRILFFSLLSAISLARIYYIFGSGK